MLEDLTTFLTYCEAGTTAAAPFADKFLRAFGRFSDDAAQQSVLDMLAGQSLLSADRRTVFRKIGPLGPNGVHPTLGVAQF
ncbi:hypothetical protein Pan44_35330 [Caulifigura coniformis]|uniref:Uncharacterized protein n=1 Tax=Caulifigura coniformis TaxID=2527983 RepID=A0A517SH82_9PLAN|nr:hypothetical protein [Caulifigura coniformis]QDT55489.1 hypothetical protein Pan44_35330 [Caulifigura coniformis]